MPLVLMPSKGILENNEGSLVQSVCLAVKAALFTAVLRSSGMKLKISNMTRLIQNCFTLKEMDKK